MVECLPVVQGGIDKNSSNVKNRGLQHFHPAQSVNPWHPNLGGRRGLADTFLTLVELGRTRMVDTRFLRILEGFAAAFVNALLRHVGDLQSERGAAVQ